MSPEKRKLLRNACYRQHPACGHFDAIYPEYVIEALDALETAERDRDRAIEALEMFAEAARISMEQGG